MAMASGGALMHFSLVIWQQF